MGRQREEAMKNIPTKYQNRRRLLLILTFLCLAIILIFSGCITVTPPISPPSPAQPEKPTPTPMPVSIPTSPKVPQEVLAIWKLEPPSGALPPYVSGEASLSPNLAEGELVEGGEISYGVVATAGSCAESIPFHLNSEHWIDVIVSSLDTEVYFGEEKPNSISVSLNKDVSTLEVHGRAGLDFAGATGVFVPFYGKVLYGNKITHTSQGKLFTSAARFFVSQGEGEHLLMFTNFNKQRGCNIGYRVYLAGSTPGWGKFAADKLSPWLTGLYTMCILGKISQEEYYEAEAEWIEQFK